MFGYALIKKSELNELNHLISEQVDNISELKKTVSYYKLELCKAQSIISKANNSEENQHKKNQSKKNKNA